MRYYFELVKSTIPNGSELYSHAEKSGDNRSLNALVALLKSRCSVRDNMLNKGAEHYGLHVENLGRGGNGQSIVDALSSGKLIISIMNPGHFTKSGHFIVLRGVTSDGKILVADPVSRTRSEQEWDLSVLLREARPDAAAGGPFWAISR
jgi:hypothetical protein